ncbi:SpoIID/LytB domain-containing protein [bacterium]|nr:SpoIID/LytB domain-containing protein [bacterium]
MRKPLLLLTACFTLVFPAPGRAQQGDRLIRIGVVEAAPSATLGLSLPATLMEGDRRVARFAANAPILVTQASESLEVTLSDGTKASAKGPLRLKADEPTPEARASVAGKTYRGELEVRMGPSALTVVNEVTLEAYLYGVVPAEVIPSWHPEALKAQAVAARTYAVAHLGQFSSLGYDLKATVASQVYGGTKLERPSTNQAVDDTRGRILTYLGKPIEAVYSDSSGGFTESCLEVWGKAVPYLQAVPDFDQQSPRYVWETTIAPDRFSPALQKLGVSIGDLVAIEPLERSYSGRLKRARLIGTTGTAEVGGEKLRFAFGLRSTFFNVAKQADGSLAFAGRGWGHGVGMSQWGAKAMADMGYSYDQILAHYYGQTTLSDGMLVKAPR